MHALAIRVLSAPQLRVPLLHRCRVPATASISSALVPNVRRSSQPTVAFANPVPRITLREILQDTILEAAFGMASDGAIHGGAPLIIDGKATADTIREEIRIRVEGLSKAQGRVRYQAIVAAYSVAGLRPKHVRLPVNTGRCFACRHLDWL